MVKDDTDNDTCPWELRWDAVKDSSENDWERLKRYGLAYRVEENDNKYHLRFDLPKKVPNHPFKFRWNLPDQMPDYKIDVRLEGKVLLVRATLEDMEIRKLSDIAASFPDRFLREFELPEAGPSFIHNYDSPTKTLDIIIEKVKVKEA